ncbi:hypothetical protein G210_3495 [Candida maltosa Xu316]|uniref:Uncharacterized protein n=1 Tax=Candida maltosa (strain Xu316) TaxID=1245528 RepID=M3JTS7_CANMX|nr:hypothetical protein G210_3495 [Candida maltosa Xu316]
MKLELVYVGLLLSRIVNSFDIAINDEEIDNPGLIIKSKFKPYLPELQENLEIPVTSKQQSLKESFIPKRKFNYPHYGLRSRFRKDVSISTSSTTTTKTTTSESTNDSDQDSDSDHEENDQEPQSGKPTITDQNHQL